MPKSKAKITARAKRLGFPKSQIVNVGKGKNYLAPLGVKKTKAKRAYGKCRDKGGAKGTCAAVAHNIQKKK